MIDKEYCMSSYLAFRYIDKDGIDFCSRTNHHNINLLPPENKRKVTSPDDIGNAIKSTIDRIQDKRCGILLSGGMDSAIIASFMNGGDAYTFRFLGGSYCSDELARAEYYAKTNKLTLHYVDINWDTVINYVDLCMEQKGAPVHSIEPQISQAAEQAKQDGVEIMLIGDGSDYVFGGMDQLLSKDWLFDDFVARYISIHPASVLKDPADILYAFEPYRINSTGIDFIGFMNNLMTRESYNSYYNAFKVSNLEYIDPYSNLVMDQPLDLARIRGGESKYLIRQLMALRYPKIPVPNKVPMPRPVDYYFANYAAPKRREFKDNINIANFTGNQKWQVWCLNRFLDHYC